VSEKEALEYLKNRNVNEEDAMRIYKLVGGRVIDLNFASDGIGNGLEFKGRYGRSMQKLVSVLITLQMWNSQCSPAFVASLQLPKFFLNTVVTKKERQLYLSF